MRIISNIIFSQTPDLLCDIKRCYPSSWTARMKICHGRKVLLNFDKDIVKIILNDVQQVSTMKRHITCSLLIFLVLNCVSSKVIFNCRRTYRALSSGR